MSETVSTAAPPDGPWIANDSTFAARLALIRQRMGWNAKEAALACGIPQQSWRSWESGVMPHGGRYFGICAQIAAVVQCDYGWLVDKRPSGSTQPSSSRASTVFDLLQGGGRNNKGMDRALLLPVPSN